MGHYDKNSLPEVERNRRIKNYLHSRFYTGENPMPIIDDIPLLAKDSSLNKEHIRTIWAVYREDYDEFYHISSDKKETMESYKDDARFGDNDFLVEVKLTNKIGIAVTSLED